MNEVYKLCIKTIDETIHKLEKGITSEDIKQYLKLQKMKIEVEKEKLKDESAEYIDNLIRTLK